MIDRRILTVAVNNISLEAAKGSFIGIMGQSGSGKSTLLNMIATIDRQIEERLRLMGRIYRIYRKVLWRIFDASIWLHLSGV